MSVTIHPAYKPPPEKHCGFEWDGWEVRSDNYGNNRFHYLTDAKRWATATFNLSGKWRRKKDGSYEEVTDEENS